MPRAPTSGPIAITTRRAISPTATITATATVSRATVRTVASHAGSKMTGRISEDLIPEAKAEAMAAPTTGVISTSQTDQKAGQNGLTGQSVVVSVAVNVVVSVVEIVDLIAAMSGQ